MMMMMRREIRNNDGVEDNDAYEGAWGMSTWQALIIIYIAVLKIEHFSPSFASIILSLCPAFLFCF